jgi:inhibitor of cysteine peptidase
MATQQAVADARQQRSQTTLLIAGIVGAVVIGIALLVGLVYIFSDEVGMPVVVTSEDDGTTMRMIPDAQVLVVLDSNATTGYEWAIDEVDTDVVEFLGSEYIAPTNGAVGQGGTQELEFRALAEGTTTLRLKYWRSWEGDASIVDRWEMTFEVRD